MKKGTRLTCVQAVCNTSLAVCLIVRSFVDKVSIKMAENDLCKKNWKASYRKAKKSVLDAFEYLLKSNSVEKSFPNNICPTIYNSQFLIELKGSWILT